MRLWRKLPAPIEDPAELGRWGEAIAADYLRNHNHRILRRNFRYQNSGEIDLITRDKTEQVLCFIEVKTRTSERFGRPALAVDEHKRRRILRGARKWLKALNLPEIRFRFDIIEVVVENPEEPPVVRHLRNAFHFPENVFR